MIINTCTEVNTRRTNIKYDIARTEHAVRMDNIIPAFLAAFIDVLWEPGDEITFAFMDGRKLIKNKVVETFMEWEKYANIKFVPEVLTKAMVRISFNQEGSWSYLGTECLDIPRHEPTVNFGWLTTRSQEKEIQRVVLHEFGHVLGMIHEHQNPNNIIPWNKDAIYDYYAGPPNNWSRQQVDVNFFEVYDHTRTNSSEFDSQSIMLYPIPNEFTIGDFAVGWNTVLSDMDKEWMERIYPFTKQDSIALPINMI